MRGLSIIFGLYGGSAILALLAAFAAGVVVGRITK